MGYNVLRAGTYDFLIEIQDSYPGLDPEEALLARRKHAMEVADPVALERDVHGERVSTCRASVCSPPGQPALLSEEGVGSEDSRGTKAAEADSAENLHGAYHPPVALTGARFFTYSDALGSGESTAAGVPLARGLRVTFGMVGLVDGFEYALVFTVLARSGERRLRSGEIMQEFTQNFTYSGERSGKLSLDLEISPGEAASFMYARSPVDGHDTFRCVIELYDLGSSESLHAVKAREDAAEKEEGGRERAGEESAEAGKAGSFATRFGFTYPGLVALREISVTRPQPHVGEVAVESGGKASVAGGNGQDDGGAILRNETAWQEWVLRGFREVATASSEANAAAMLQVLALTDETAASPAAGAGDRERGGTAAEAMQGARAGGAGGRNVACDDGLWDTPVVIMTHTAADSARVVRTRELLRAIGFRNISVPPSYDWSEIDMEALLARRVVSRSLWQRLHRRADTDRIGMLRYAALTLSQAEQVRRAGRAGAPLLMVEDDLLPAGPVALVRDRVCRSLGRVPPGAEMVQLEFCFESCSRVGYSREYPLLARADMPSCSAAIFFSAAGARHVADLIFPIFDVIDRMYPALIHMGWVRSWLVVPPVFYQDQFYASHFNRHRRAWNQAEVWCDLSGKPCHQPALHTPVCWEVATASERLIRDLQQPSPGWAHRHGALDLRQVDLRQVGLIATGRLLASLVASSRVRLPTELAQGGVEQGDGQGEKQGAAARDAGRPRHDDTAYVWLQFAVLGGCSGALGERASAWAALGRILYHTPAAAAAPGEADASSSPAPERLVLAGEYVLDDSVQKSGLDAKTGRQGGDAGGGPDGVVLRIGKESNCHPAHALESCWIQSTFITRDGRVQARCGGRVFLQQWDVVERRRL
jgi:hypothetical protein